MDERAEAAVEMHHVSKSYGGVQALRDVSFILRRGEVHALLGENGAGKSTLMKILSGEVGGYRGNIRIGGKPVRLDSPASAARAGIAMIHQELDLVGALSVAENVFLGREPKTRLRTVDRRAMLRRTRELLTRTGIDLDPRRPVEELRTGEQQLVVIAKALSRRARFIVMDEPTSALSSPEVARLFTVIDELRAGGAGIVYISHRMDEIGQVADRATVLRNGEVVTEFDARSMSATQASEAMVGRPLRQLYRTREPSPRVGDESGDPVPQPGEELLRLENFGVVPRRRRAGRRDPAGISLTVHRGEIVGVAGLLGSGRTELLESLYGADPPGRWSGQVLMNGRPARPRSPRQALRMGIAFVPEDRRIAGLALEHSVLANTVLSVLDRIARCGVVARAAERRQARTAVDWLGIKLASLTVPVGALSGGNQQKVVLGRYLLTEPSLLLLDEPTRGVDIGAKAEIYRLLDETVRRGVGVLLASSEPAELIGVCDRVVVLRGGRAVRQLDTTRVGEAELLAATMGEATR